MGLGFLFMLIVLHHVEDLVKRFREGLDSGYVKVHCEV